MAGDADRSTLDMRIAALEELCADLALRVARLEAATVSCPRCGRAPMRRGLVEPLIGPDEALLGMERETWVCMVCSYEERRSVIR